MNRPAHGGNRVWAAQLAQCAPHELLDFSASINPLGPPQSAIAALQDSISDLCHYPDPDYTALRQVLGAHHQIDPDWILPGNGAAELLTWAAWDLAQLDCTVLLTPAFSDYFRALRLWNAQVLTASMLYDSQSLRYVHPDGQAGILLNNPHNPTGQSWCCVEFYELLDRYELIVIDEAFMEFTGSEGERHNSFIAELCSGSYEHVIVLRSLTKFYSLPGLRLGYAVGHPDRLRRWQAMRDPWSVNSLAAQVGEVMINDHAFAQATWDWLTPARTQLEQSLAQFPALTPRPSAANFLLVKTQSSAPLLQAELLQHDRILIRDCLSFPELGEDYFRVAVRTAADNQRLLDALSQIPSLQG
ncbi:MAG: threonine-phosphate decarboxylase [Spirulina sp. SIO3F2]|nr:threonine-phosphate decarboxylase [Spirulina sp. SIO3F2]